MFTELFFIKRFILFVGSPVISFVLVVCGILIFSSLGGLWAQGKNRLAIRPILILVVAVLVSMAYGLQLVSSYIIKLPATLRIMTILLFLLPSGFFMGLPFPLGMRNLLSSPVQRAYAWSVNGCASVLASIAAAQIAISFGIPLILIAAAGSYLGALIVCVKE
jgi:hypothetical protein